MRRRDAESTRLRVVSAIPNYNSCMASLIPHRFLIRVAHPCPYVKEMPRDADEEEHLLDLPESARLHNYAELDGQKSFADVRVAWNDFGLGIQLVVKAKEKEPTGDTPRSADGLTLWLDTRDTRASHRASRFCHQFHFLASGGGAEKDEPHFTQSKINRALQDAPFANPSEVLFRVHRLRGGYRLEAFLPAAALTGFDPEQHNRLGLYYVVRDQELGDQFLAVGWDFPIADDPSLWDALELVTR